MLSKVKKQDGFTIIEVMIVLAIAGLILLIVFLAVPALQRNSRNTQRKNDVASLVSAITEAVNNNNGNLPADNTAFKNTAGNNWKPSYYTDANTNVTYTKNTTALTANHDPNDKDKIFVDTYATCNSTGTASTGTGASTRSIAVTYSIENGTSGVAEQCVTAQ